MLEKKTKSKRNLLKVTKKVARVVGVSLVVPFFIWMPLSLVMPIPSMIDVFGMDGLRTPTGIVIGGLMLAAFGFEDF